MEAKGPLRVLHAAPRGEVGAEQQVMIVFDRPLRTFGVDLPPVAGVQIEPPVGGRWEWSGTHAMLFVPDYQRFPTATRYRVTVPETLRALDGTSLVAPHTFEFMTPRPRVRFDREGIMLSATDPILLNVDAPIELSALTRGLTVSAEPVSVLSYVVEEDDEAQHRHYRIRPTVAWPLSTKLTVAVAASLSGKEGPLAVEEEVRGAFHTMPPPRFVLRCDGVEPQAHCAHGYARLESTNAVNPGELAAGVRVEPPVPVEIAWGVTLGPLAPSTRYVVHVPAGLAGHAGGHTEAQTLTLTTGRSRSLWVGLESGQIEPALMRPAKVSLCDVPTFEWAAVKLSPFDVLGWLTASDERERDAASPQVTSGFRTQRVRLGLSCAGSDLLDVSSVHGAAYRGGLFVSARAEPRLHHRRVLQVSDLALTTKLWTDGASAWVSTLSDSLPVQGARVSLLAQRESVWTGLSDERGHVALPRDVVQRDLPIDARNVGLLVEHGGDWSVQPLVGDRARVGSGSRGESIEQSLALFIDRGIYRPGETIRVKGILQDETSAWGRAAGNEHVTLRLVKLGAFEDATPKATRSLRTNRFGGFSAELPIPHDDAHGSWQIAASSRAADSKTTLTVTDFRPSEVDAKLEAPKETWAGEPARLSVRASYYSGEALPNALLFWRILGRPSRYAPPGSEGRVTNASVLGQYLDEPEERVRHGVSEARLDARGEGTLEWTYSGTLLEPQELRADVGVVDLARQVTGASARFLLHPARYYVALKTPSYGISGNPIGFDVLTLDAAGQKLLGHVVEMTLWRDTQRVAEDKSNRSELTRSGSCRFTSAVDPRSCRLVPREDGVYVLHARSTDQRGQVAQSATHVYVAGVDKPYVRGVRTGWAGSCAPRAQPEVRLELDREQYSIGDTARLLVHSPFDRARAFVTVERTGIYYQAIEDIGRSRVFELPVQEAMGRGASVEVLLHRVEPRKTARGDEQAIAQSSVWLDVDPNERRLAVDVEPDRRAGAPGDPVEVEVRVRDRQGRPREAEVTLWAVDEGVLALTGYPTPDIVPLFTLPRPDQTETFDSRLDLGALPFQRKSEPTVCGGSLFGGGGARSDPLRNVRVMGDPTPLFLPHLRTSNDGKVRASLAVPGQLTRYRLMAVAHATTGEVGSGDSSFTTSLPLSARAALPRFLRVGDEIRAGVVLTSQDDTPSDVTVRAEVAGLRLLEAGQSSTRVDATQPRELGFGFRAEHEGNAKLTFRLASAKQSDALEATLPVLRPSVQETVALYGETANKAREALGDLSGIDARRSTLSVTLASGPLANMDSEFEQLLRYPHTCTEQLVARLLVLGPLRDFWKTTTSVVPSDADERLAATLGQVLERMQYSGGYGYWGYDEPSVWLSAYVLHGLERLRAAGYKVPADATRKTTDYLSEALREADVPLEPVVQALLVDALTGSSVRAETKEATRRLLGEWQSLSLVGQAYLLHAVAARRELDGASVRRVAELADSIVNSLRMSGDAAYADARASTRADLLDSPERTTALVLRALCAYDADHPMLAPLVRGLLAQRRGEGWSSTHATSWALMALDDYRKVREDRAPAFRARVWSSGAKLFEWAFSEQLSHAKSFRASMVGLAPHTPLLFEKDGQGTLFYTARLHLVSSELPKAPVGRGFLIEHLVTPLHDSERLPPSEDLAQEYALGSTVFGEVLVVTWAERHQVVVDVPLPAGFEPVDPRLSTTPKWLRGSPWNRMGWQRTVHQGSAEVHREYHDDRILFFAGKLEPGLHRFSYLARVTTPGRFVVPPARVEEMYAPEHFARTAGWKVVVQPVTRL
jgi:hypothetical protein